MDYEKKQAAIGARRCSLLIFAKQAEPDQ